MKLIPGGNCPVPSNLLTVRVITGVEADISAYRLMANGQVANDSDMIFYGQPTCSEGAIKLLSEGVNTHFSVDLLALNSSIEKIAFACTSSPNQTISSLGKISIHLEQQGEIIVSCDVDMTNREEAALILGELYRRNNEWKFRFVSQGFKGGLKPLAELYGVEIDEDQNGSTGSFIPPAEAKKVNLSKISLTKNNPTISLEKRNDYGLIKINLNWHQDTSSNGFFSSSNAIDLDLGCFIRLKDGTQMVVQAVGKRFGNLDHEPFVKLLGDDRTGSVTEGEWLHVNGKEWREIDEILVFAFIYDGIPDWTKTDGVVTIYVPNESPVETRLTEEGSSNGMCAIARLLNQDGAIKVERINQYFSGHAMLDKAFDWGFRWVKGSK